MNVATIYRRHAGFALQGIESHKVGKPFVLALSAFLRANKSFGSRDRRTIRAMCYAWFRLGFSLKVDKLDQVLLSYLTLENDDKVPEEITVAQFGLPGNWLTLTLPERLEILKANCGFELNSLFPSKPLSPQLDHRAYCLHQLSQPSLWLSVTRESKVPVIEQLARHGIEVLEKDGALSLPSSTSVDTFLKPHMYEVQDYSSQAVLSLLNDYEFKSVWDCCAGSGGKGLTLLRNQPKLDLYVSDIRPNIIRNLQDRFKRHRLEYFLGRIDMTTELEQLSFVQSSGGEFAVRKNHFNLVLADLPCSGSGTWNRNPEYVSSFEAVDKAMIENQQLILRNAWNFVAKGGWLMMITCSVFEIENEKNVEAFVGFSQAKVASQGYIKGHESNSDSMFYALMQK